MTMRNVAATVSLLAVLAVVVSAFAGTMHYLADRTSVGLVETQVRSTPILSDVSGILTVSGQTATETAEVRPTRTPVPYDSNTAMYLVFAGIELSPGFGPLNDRTINALAAIRANNDKSQVRVIIESLRYLYANDIIDEAVATLEHLTGQTSIGKDWKRWSEWVHRNRDAYPLPSEYAEWKLNYLRQLDGRFGAFLSPALAGESDVDLAEIEWGGVIPDGIPDLQNPDHVNADDPAAEYLEYDERVIGVTINGEHRAYPLRIVNAHELVNDELGGEPLSLTW